MMTVVEAEHPRPMWEEHCVQCIAGQLSVVKLNCKVTTKVMGELLIKLSDFVNKPFKVLRCNAYE